MRLPIRARAAATVALVLALLSLAAAAAPRRPARARAAPSAATPRGQRSLPPLLLMERRRVLGDTTRPVASRLLVRDPDGALHDLLPVDSLRFLGRPSVSPDGGRIAFAGWLPGARRSRLCIVKADGSGLACAPLPDTLLRSEFWPCWVAPHHLVLASLHFGGSRPSRFAAQWELFLVRDDGSHLERLTVDTSYTGGAVLDPGTGRLLFSRGEPEGRQIVTLTPGLDDLRLAAGPVDTAMGRVSWLAASPDGRVAVDLVRPGAPAVALFGAQADAGRGGLPRAVGPGEIVAGPPANTLAFLPDGRLLGSIPAADSASFPRLFVVDSDGRNQEPVPMPREGSWQTAVPLVPSPAPVAVSDSALDAPRPSRDATFAYEDLNVFAGGPLDTPLPAPLLLADSLRLRARVPFAPATGADSSVRLREVPVRPDGSARLDSLPVDLPLVLEMVARDGRVLLSAHGFGRTAWVNAGSPRVRRCVGCHLGHSALPLPPDGGAARWFNAAPSAEVTASSSAAGTTGPRAAVDRRTQGSAREVGWIAAGATGQWLRLTWRRPLELREIVLHGLRPERGARVTVRACEVVLRLRGTELSRRLVNVPLGFEPLHLGVGLTVADEIEIDFLRVSGLALGRRAAALAEVEATGRLP